ncbi:MAG: AMP-binding protein, partial [Desulfobacterales bacterium]|nr:AMP-binding protein [Desulfobacterales bacterium]
MVCGDARWTYAQWMERSTRLACALGRLGLKRQDRVGILAMNCAEYFDVFACCHLTGMIVSTVNFRLAPPEMLYILQDSAPSVLIFEAQYTEVVDSLRSQLPWLRDFICIGECPDWAVPYDQFLASAANASLPFESRPEDAAHLIYTSGTTGRPKGVIRGQAAELALARTQAGMMEMKINGRILVMMPMFHLGAISMFLPQQLMAGTVVLHRKFDPLDILQTIEREQIVTTHMAPVMVKAVLDHPDLKKHDLSSLQTLCYSAAPMPVAVLRRGLDAIGPVFLNSWGSTEVGSGTNFPKH